MSDSTFDAPVWHNGKALRKGYTTGSCATRQRESRRTDGAAPASYSSDLHCDPPASRYV
jgi:hypothetical protein